PRRAQRERLLAPRGRFVQRRRAAGGEPDPRRGHQLVHGARHLPSRFDPDHHDHHAARDDHHHSADDDVHHLHEQHDDDPAPDHDHDVYDLHVERAPGDNLHHDVRVDHHDDPAPDHDHDDYHLHVARARPDNVHHEDRAGHQHVRVAHHDAPSWPHHGTHLLGPAVGVRAAGDFHRDGGGEEPRRRHPDRHGDLQGRLAHPRHRHAE